VADRIVEVIDDRQTGETILDEALKMMKMQQEVEKLSINSWVDLLSGEFLLDPFLFEIVCDYSTDGIQSASSNETSGETWNVMKIGFQLKQVRERLAKGLVDKGVLRTEKRNFLLFDMATHPVADVRTKESIVTRVVTLLTSTTTALPSAALDKEGVQCRVTRAVCLACAAYTASVLDNAFGRLAYEDREAAFQRCDEILGEFICWPFGTGGTNGAGPLVPATAAGRRRQATRIASGGGAEVTGRDVVLGLLQEVKKESIGGDEDVGFELVAGVLEVLSKLDSLI
jgi:Golgi phosphoprotein 3